MRETLYRVFHPGWVTAGIGIGLGLQLLAWVTGFGLVGGLTGYVVMGLLVGLLSPGDTVFEPAVAAFLIASIGFVIDHLLLSVLGIGLVLAVGYGLLGFLLGLAGGWVGERLQAIT
ncbi:MAG: hypothetical protein ABEH59_05810 [Halobacteriales archaeon]